jgi:hypothetical protein
VKFTLRPFKRWPRIPGVYDIRECPECAALVYADAGQRGHQAHHDRDEEPEEWSDPGGYIIGNGELPASVRGGED